MYEYYYFFSYSMKNIFIYSDLLIFISIFTSILSGWIYLFAKLFTSYWSSRLQGNELSIITSNKSKKTKNFYKNTKTSFPFVSIILPARNEQENIKKCLHSLLAQDYCNFEIIAVDDRSEERRVGKEC